MVPGAEDDVVPVEAVALFHRRIHQLRPVEVLLVEVSADMQLRDLRILHVAERRVGAPETVIRRVLDKVVPGGDRAVEIALVDVPERSEVQIPIIEIELREGEVAVGGLVVLHFVTVFESVTEPERAIMMKVVAEEEIAHTGLLRGRLQRGMRVDRADERQPAGIGYTGDANFAIVIGYMLHQPVDGVPGVGAFVDRAGMRFVSQWLMDLHGAFGFVFAADVLHDEDVAVLGHVVVWEAVWKDEVAVGRDGDVGAVWGALDQDRGGWGAGGVGCGDGGEDDGEELDAVTHGDHGGGFVITDGRVGLGEGLAGEGHVQRQEGEGG